MFIGISHKVKTKGNGLLQLVLVVVALLLASPLASAQSASSALKMNPKAYTGKRAWWLNYQYFPELTIFAQNEDTVPDIVHRYAFYVNGGYAGLGFVGAGPSSDRKFGLGLGAQYNHFINPHWGFRTGLEFSFASSDASMGSLKDVFLKTDSESDQIRYHYDFSAVTEDYKVYLLNLPIMLAYQQKKIMAGAGFKLAFPFSVKYDQSVSNIYTKAYFPQYDVWVDDSWVLGCGSYASRKSSNKFVAAPIVLLGSADVEYLFPIGQKYSLGVGAYIDYSLSSSFSFRRNQLDNVQTEQNSMVGTTNDVPVFIVTNSMLSGMKNYESDNVVSHIKYFNAGVKVSMIINSYGPPKPKTKPY